MAFRFQQRRHAGARLVSHSSANDQRRLAFEPLEDRRLLAVFTVDNLGDSGTGSLRDAITQANATTEADRIDFSVTGTINIASQLPTITEALTINGPGADQLTIDAGSGATSAPGDGHSIFFISSSAPELINVTLRGLTLTGGDPSNSSSAGAIWNQENLTVISSSIVGNTTGANFADGGGIKNQGSGTLKVIDSTISDNTAARWGGGISNSGSLSLINSTVSGNTAGRGGGIYNLSGRSATISSSTITENSASARGGGIEARGTEHVTSSIIAGNTSPNSPNISGTLETDANNLIDVNPLIGPLADNGGTTQTHALLPGSLALDAGSVTTPTHVYELNNSLADANGGPALVPNGGTLTATGYDFEPDQGLSLSNALIDPADYTIKIAFSFDGYATGSTWQSIINFKNLGSDDGLYSYFDRLVFYNSGNVVDSGSIFNANTTYNLVFSRESATDRITASIDGQQVWSYFDTEQAAVFSETNNIIHFFQDNGSEEQAGFVDRISIYDGLVDPPLEEDQRGAEFNRVVGAAADIGAYEAQRLPSGNFVNDATVDGADFLAWQRGFGTVDAVLGDGNSDDDTDVDASDLAAWSATYGETVSTVGGGQPHNNVQASIGLNYLIATQGIFPSNDLVFPEDGTPVLGQITLFAGAFEPAGWEFADGELLPIAGNEALFSVIGTTYGGNGRTNFALPDLRGRTTLGEGNGPGLTGRSLGQMTGVETVTLSTSQLPTHSHPLPGPISSTDSTGNGTAHQNLQPSLGMNYLISSTGLFPQRDGSGPFHGGFYGAVTAFAGGSFYTNSPSAPSLDGQLINISTNPALFSILGTTYGGDGRVTFQLPDLRSRSPLHDSNAVRSGQRVGTETVALTTANLPAHDHELPGTDAASGTTGNATAHENRQPSLALNYVINLIGDFPAPNGPFGAASLGAINVFAGNFAPQGSAFLDGQLLSIAQHSALFSIIGDTYGGDGITTFALPDLRGRTPVGMGQGAGLSHRSLGESFGENSVALTVDQIPGHTHDITPPENPAALTADLVDAALAAEWMNAYASREQFQWAPQQASESILGATEQRFDFSSSLIPASNSLDSLDLLDSTDEDEAPAEISEEVLASVFS